MKISLFLVGAALAPTATTWAQPHADNRSASATLPLSEDIKRVVAIDAYNVILAEKRDPAREFVLINVRHVYAGGLARLLGGAVVSTRELVSPQRN